MLIVVNQPELSNSITDLQFIKKEENGLSTEVNEKEVDVTSDKRFTYININKKYIDDQENEVFVKTKIVKDKFLNTTETHIKKIFVHHKNDTANVIIRDITIDRYNTEAISNNSSIYFQLNDGETLENRISLLLEETVSPLLLN